MLKCSSLHIRINRQVVQHQILSNQVLSARHRFRRQVIKVSKQNKKNELFNV